MHIWAKRLFKTHFQMITLYIHGLSAVLASRTLRRLYWSDQPVGIAFQRRESLDTQIHAQNTHTHTHTNAHTHTYVQRRTNNNNAFNAKHWSFYALRFWMNIDRFGMLSSPHCWLWLTAVSNGVLQLAVSGNDLHCSTLWQYVTCNAIRGEEPTKYLTYYVP